jgi:hypothetical protein
VGAFRDDSGSNLNQGSAYVFKRQGGSFVEQQKLTASDGAAGDQFGLSVALSGVRIVVGAFRDDSIRGSAYVFKTRDDDDEDDDEDDDQDDDGDG